MSIVVIGYNDAEHLPAALRSAQAQTLRDIEIVVVDDASSDASFDIASGFAQRDPRFHVHRLDTNSGGCSRPRNTGLEHATGEFVLFLDSDDVLPRRAVSRLYDAATRADADVTCGRMVRRHHHPRRHLPSNDELYRRADVLDGVLARPDQLRDTPACGKLFRRTFLEANGLRFPERLLFEDLLFTTTAYAAAGRIAIVPALCYVWNVGGSRPSRRSPTGASCATGGTASRSIAASMLDLAARPRAADCRQPRTANSSPSTGRSICASCRAFPADQRSDLLAVAADYVSPRELDR